MHITDFAPVLSATSKPRLHLNHVVPNLPAATAPTSSEGRRAVSLGPVSRCSMADLEVRLHLFGPAAGALAP